MTMDLLQTPKIFFIFLISPGMITNVKKSVYFWLIIMRKIQQIFFRVIDYVMHKSQQMYFLVIDYVETQFIRLPE